MRKTGRLISARLKLKKVIFAVQSAGFIGLYPALNIHIDFLFVLRTRVTTRRTERHAERDEGVPADTERLGVHQEDAAREAFKKTAGDCLFFLPRCC